MGRREKKIFEINDQILALERHRAQVAEELGVHRHLNYDAQRDAVVSGSPLDRADARETAGDVARFEAAMQDLDRRRAKLEAKRAKLIDKL